jgi:hypothetical protein
MYILVPTTYNLLQRRHDIVNRKRHVVGRRVFYVYVFFFPFEYIMGSYMLHVPIMRTRVCIGMGYLIIRLSTTV